MHQKGPGDVKRPLSPKIYDSGLALNAAGQTALSLPPWTVAPCRSLRDGETLRNLAGHTQRMGTEIPTVRSQSQDTARILKLAQGQKIINLQGNKNI